MKALLEAVKENEILAQWESGRRLVLWLRDAEQCKACRAMHYIFVNAHGRTTCSGCAPEEGK